ncbi:unnamed protein product, partial [Rotaria socialis]
MFTIRNRNCNRNSKFEIVISMKKQFQNLISKFEIAIKIKKQIQNNRFASMAHETKHDFWLK